MWKDKVPEFYKETLIPAYLAKTHMEYSGVRFDNSLARRMSYPIGLRIEHLIDKMRKLTGDRNYNPNSSKQNIKYISQTIGRAVKNVDKDFLDGHTGMPLVKELANYRKLTKLKGTFLDGIKSDKNGYVHTTYNVHRTVTGRFSSSGPNLQQIPKGLHKLFLPDTGHSWVVGGDYSQLEYKVIIGMSNIPELIDLINKGHDIHTITANIMLGKGLDKNAYTSDERRRAKAVNFGVMYGMGMDRLADALQCSTEEAIAFKTKHFAAFEVWRQSVVDEILQTKRSVSAFGRVRRFPLITRQTVGDVIREGFNHKIQSTASDVCASALVKLERDLPVLYGARMVLTVHDDLRATCPDRVQQEVGKYMQEIMEKRYDWSPVKFTAEIEIKPRW
jgi:DNA polymerase-1